MSTRQRQTEKKLTRREMLKLSGGLAAGSVLAASVPVVMEQTPVAQAQGPVTLEVYDPTGASEVTQLLAKRLDTLEGKTICELSGDAWEPKRTFPVIRGLLQKKYPTAKIIPYTEFPHGMVSGGGYVFEIDSDRVAAQVKERGCQAVIVGNAG